MRVKGVFRPQDYPLAPDAKTRQELDELFALLCPGQTEPQMPPLKAPWAIMTAQSPRLPLLLAQVGSHVKDMSWCQRADLRELSLQAVAFHYRAEFSFHSHLGVAQTVGLGHDRVAAIPYWRNTTLFDDEQRLVVEYSLAAAAGEVSDELFARVVSRYGERGAIEFTTAVAFWCFWAVINNAMVLVAPAAATK